MGTDDTGTTNDGDNKCRDDGWQGQQMAGTMNTGTTDDSDDTQPGNPNKTPKRVLFGITQVRGRLQFILNFHQSPVMTHQMLQRDFGMCEVFSGTCKVFSGCAKYFRSFVNHFDNIVGRRKGR
jgi:hypothetical protein